MDAREDTCMREGEAAMRGKPSKWRRASWKITSIPLFRVLSDCKNKVAAGGAQAGEEVAAEAAHWAEVGRVCFRGAGGARMLRNTRTGTWGVCKNVWDFIFTCGEDAYLV